MRVQRIAPRPADDWDDEVREAFAVLLAPPQAGHDASGPKPNVDESVRTALTGLKAGEADAMEGQASSSVPNIIGLYAWHPDLVRGWMPFSNHLRHCTLPGRARELLILRTVWLRRGEYQWAQHARMGRAAGLSDAEVAAVATGERQGNWRGFEAALLRAVDEMCADRAISDETWQQLEANLDRKQLIDLVFTIAAYDMHCLVFSNLGIELDPGMERFPSGRAGTQQNSA
jgi:4-carboxymuconolactone decarboxylase